ncbi:pyridoxamine 5'-phosphate oxidase family protein [Pontivivens insulae]|uniref:Pyridoxamine 5'-phosphate oxidase N-terminal domain-containing protein n=1 Tax=Pontivivens insulae TaxID=1639689 RepID=A0A2R8A7S9_9RHOB|nr:pyridoxamine 5'-phosphate oxidase family protein [Pontivivens insulae]RED18348.1 hypothetical protein DFR53_0543 [Pontivivens insulae]SPF28246.1 hypothetical protein POI8812_00544 [Pontivivens insulae]
MRITTEEQLREHYRPKGGRSVEKELTSLDMHCRAFIAASPFCVVGTRGPQGQDVTPRGDAPGFVRVDEAGHLLLPDRPGNNRLDTLTNLLHDPQISLIFMIPTVAETLRVRGSAEIRVDDDLRAQFEVDGKRPASVLKITVSCAYLHCAKAFMRSGLWSPQGWPEARPVPSMGQMIRDQIGSTDRVEGQAEMEARYQKALY